MTATSLHLTPPDARRAGLVVVGGGNHPNFAAVCAGFAEQGYEVMAPSVEGVDAAVLALVGPVVMLGVGEGAAAVLAASRRLPQVTVVSLFDPAPAQLDVGSAGCPVIAHVAIGLDGAASAAMEVLRASWPDMVVYPYRAEPGFIFGDSDAAQLARLRTLQLFHRAGGKGEMGG